jgi:hypothetical protein
LQGLLGRQIFHELYLLVVHVLHHRAQVAHVERGATDRTFGEMVQLGLGDAVNVAAGMARDVGDCSIT